MILPLISIEIYDGYKGKCGVHVKHWTRSVHWLYIRARQREPPSYEV